MKAKTNRKGAHRYGIGAFVLLGWILWVGSVQADNNGPWTPEQSKTADHVPGTPTDPRGFYPPVTRPGTDDVPPSVEPKQTEPAAPYTPSHYSYGGWTPEKSKLSDKLPSDAPHPRGWYPPEGDDGKPDTSVDEFLNKVATSNLANPLIQGGKGIGRTYEAAQRGDNMGAAIEANDAVGRLISIGAGAKEGAAIGTAFGGVPGGILGGIVGGFLGNAAWNKTAGALNDKLREMHDQQRQQARMQAVQGSRQSVRSAGSSASSATKCTCK